MSGAFCDGCGEGSLLPDPSGCGKSPVRCDLCGWTADGATLPRKWMDGDDVPWTKRERKQAGTLFFLWIDATEAALGEAMRLLGETAWCVSPRVLVELDTRPTEGMLARLRELPGVTRVWMAP